MIRSSCLSLSILFCSASIVITKYLGIMPIAVPDVFFSHLIKKLTGDLCSETSFEDVFLFILFFFSFLLFPLWFLLFYVCLLFLNPV